MYNIKIKEGHDSSSYFWIQPVKVNFKGNDNKITSDDVEETKDEISIEEGDVDCFLAHFFYKYFDKELVYNRYRYDSLEGYISYFEWYLEHNFYTYNTVKKMLLEISEVAKLLSTDYDNPKLKNIKERFLIDFMVDEKSDIDLLEAVNKSEKSEEEAIRQNIDVVIDFYNRFVQRMYRMMNDNPDVDLISIMGP